MKNFLSFIYFFIKFPKLFLNTNFYKAFYKKNGLEIGGPSKIFTKKIPIYRILNSLDGVNFKENNLWRERGSLFKFNNEYISESIDLKSFKDNQFDFILSSHSLEHSANPLKALFEFKRVVKNGGYLLIIIPKKDHNFDRKRPITSFETILNKFESNAGEEDLSSLEEILELHDLGSNPEADDFSNFINMALNNYDHRALHHHVFDMSLLKQVFNFIGLKLIVTETNKDEFISFLKKEN
jgi:SAM-dependent methyltransferase